MNVTSDLPPMGSLEQTGCGVIHELNRSKTAPPSQYNLDGTILDDAHDHLLSRSRTENIRHRKNFDSRSSFCDFMEKLSESKQKELLTRAITIKNDGSIELDVDKSADIVPKLFDLDRSDHKDEVLEEEEIDPKSILPMNIAMLIVGTRGDVQPFVAIGIQLKGRGHRVRLASHANFRDFIISNGLEFYPIGGDPKVLATYMVKNKGFLPSDPSEIMIQRKQIKSIMDSLLPACTEPDGDTGISFRADAIIANPPAYGHVHVAEYLKVPICICFTMPWTPTNEFPHPLARVNQRAGYKLSYNFVDWLIWWGTRDLINEFRVKTLNLLPIRYFSKTQGSISDMPTCYIWSPHLVPKPQDWGPEIDVVGFCFLNLASDYKPPKKLEEWIQAGEKPIYVGFGSLPVEDPGKMTDIVVQALKETGQRGIIDRGWGGLGKSLFVTALSESISKYAEKVEEIPEFIFLLENCPHDWLFPQCAAVVHHGGAGTTAAGLKAGCPTTIVPFFGDQPFWGEQVHARGVGPPPIYVNDFTLERVVDAITFMLNPEVKQKALDLSINLQEEDGVEGVVKSFEKHYLKSMISCVPETEPPENFIQRLFITIRRLSCLSCVT